MNFKTTDPGNQQKTLTTSKYLECPLIYLPELIDLDH